MDAFDHIVSDDSVEVGQLKIFFDVFQPQNGGWGVGLAVQIALWACGRGWVEAGWRLGGGWVEAGWRLSVGSKKFSRF